MLRPPDSITFAELERRLDDAEGRVSMALDQWALLLAILLPEAHLGGETPAEATDTLPGTAARMAVYAQRAERREAMHHPDDLDEDDNVGILPPATANGSRGARSANGVPVALPVVGLRTTDEGYAVREPKSARKWLSRRPLDLTPRRGAAE